MAQLLRLEGQKAQRTYYAENYDHFSNLSEPIVHHIFGFLGTKDIARIGTLSKRCREMFISSPYLKFASICSYDNPLCKQFSDYVDRVLSLRNSSEIRSLSLRWVCDNNECDVDVHLVDKWIDIAVRRGVQEIEIEVGVREDAMFNFPNFRDAVFKLPKCIFISRSLRVLKLDMRYNRLQEPTGALPSLEDLSLCSLQVSESCLEKWVSSARPSLKRLTISNVQGVFENLNIVSKSLEELDISVLSCKLLKNVDISTERLGKLCLDLKTLFTRHLHSMKIAAPNLQELTWIAGMASNVELSEFKLLKNATLSVGICNDYVEGFTIGNRLAKLFQSVRFVSALQINSEVLEWYRWKAVKFNEQHSNGFRNLLGDQLSMIEMELKGKGHEVVFFVGNMIKAAKGLRKITIVYSREYYSEMLSKMRNEISATALLPLEVNLVEKEFGGYKDPEL
ncbi:putative F-box/LRR-repeat protein [Ananas comosus]|uniref:Putative F-box/LRR-repeat protein n=1 Tax=Ananas comosus TaxID=4615 RepID=A0A199VHC4_ANACO|nr:putative F-box/LRR-repeat protein [Ananas comosus]